MTDADPPGRRFVLAAVLGAGIGGVLPRAGWAGPAGGSLLVAGPAGGTLDRWAAVIAPTLARGLASALPLSRDAVGSADGVTGANHFEALASPDGSIALLAPGAAMLAWLVGDARSHFDPSVWVPTLATASAGILASRVPVARMRPGQKLRVAASGPTGPALPVLLGLELLGLEVVPVFGVPDASSAVDAVVSNAADIAFLHGHGIADQVQSLAAAGAPPVLSLGVPAGVPAGIPTGVSTGVPGGVPSEAASRDPLFPHLPTMTELLGTAGNSALIAPWRATAAAAQLDSALVLPQQTPAAMVAAWRRAAGLVSAARDIMAEADKLGLRLLPPPSAMAGMCAAIPDQPALLDLRRWLADRWGWRPA